MLFMSVISIRQLEEFTGIKSHTIRIWEKRFGLFTPDRKKGNIRYYSVDDFRHLLNISFLNRSGIKISRIVSMKKEEINSLLGSYTKKDDRLALYINRLIFAMFAFDVNQFEDTLTQCQEEFGTDVLIREVIVPFLEKTGLVYYKDRSNETHFAVTAIRRKIMLGIESCNAFSENSKTALLFLPDGEHYDLLLLYVSYVLRCKGIKVIYLGTNVPQKNILEALSAKKPDYVFIHVPPRRKYNAEELCSYMQKHVPHSKLFIVRSQPPRPAEQTNGVQFIHFSEADSV